MKLPDNFFQAFSKKEFILFDALILTSIGLIVFSNTFSNGFHLDDFHTLVFNNHIHSLREIPSFFLSAKGFSGTPYVSGYRPVTATLNAINYAFSQTTPFGYHLINLLIHLLCSFFVSLIGFTLSRKRSVGLLAGLLFLVHPMNTEAVNYISGRTSSLSSLFYLASFWAFLEYRKKNERKWMLFSLAVFILALLSKESSVTFPLLLMTYDYFYSSKLPFRKKGVTWAIYSIPLLFFLIARYYIMHLMAEPGSMAAAFAKISFTEMTQRVFLGSLYLSTHYLFLYLFPYPLTADHPFPKLHFDWINGAYITFWILILWMIIRYRKKPLVPFLTIWFIVTLLPLFLLPAISTLSLFQENRSYLSGAGICIILALGIIGLERLPTLQFAGKVRLVSFLLIFILLSGFSYMSYCRNQVWKNEVTLWGDAFHKNASSFIVSFSLGYGYLTERQWEKAEAYFKNSLGLSPPKEYLYYIHNNMGVVYENQRELDKAFYEYQTAAQLSSHLPEAHLNLGHYYLKKGIYRKAVEEMETAVDLEYGHMEQRILTAIELEKLGAREEAQDLLLKISKELPFSSEYFNLRKLLEEHCQNIGKP